VAGDDDRGDINATYTYMQPFVSYVSSNHI